MASGQAIGKFKIRFYWWKVGTVQVFGTYNLYFVIRPTINTLEKLEAKVPSEQTGEKNPLFLLALAFLEP